MINEISIKTDLVGKRCLVEATVDGVMYDFWVEFSLLDIDEERLPNYTTEIVLGWLIANLKRKDSHSLNIYCSHAPRIGVVESWCLLSQITLNKLCSENEFPFIKRCSELEPSICVSWGGGKDSYAALDITTKIINTSKRYLFDFTAHKNSTKILEKIDRRNKLSINTVKELYNANIITITSNAPSRINLPNSANYFSFVPFLISEYGIDLFCFSFEAMFFYDSPMNMSFPVNRSQSYDMSRVLSAKILSLLMSRVFDKDFHIFNSNYQFTEFSAFTYVAKNCGDGLENIMMCENGGENKWCGFCTKCAQMVLYSLALELDQREIDTDFFLEESAWVAKAIENIKLNRGKWYKGLTYPGHIDSFRYVLGAISESSIANLSKRAQNNLQKIIDCYGDNNIKNEDGIYVKNLFASWPEKYASSVYNYLAKFFPVYDSPQFEKHWGDSTVLRNEELQASKRSVQFIEFLIENQKTQGNKSQVS